MASDQVLSLPDTSNLQTAGHSNFATSQIHTYQNHNSLSANGLVIFAAIFQNYTYSIVPGKRS